MKKIISKWLKYGVQTDEWFFYAFLLLLPLSIRKILYFVPINGEFNEFTSVSIFASDVFLLGAIGVRLIVLYNENTNLSRCNILNRKKPHRGCDLAYHNLKKLFHVEQFKELSQYIFLRENSSDEKNVPRGTINNVTKIFKRLSTHFIHSYYWILVLALAILLLLSTIWAEDNYLAVFKTFKLIEVGLLIFYLSLKLGVSDNNVPRETFLDSEDNSLPEKDMNCSTWNNSMLKREIFLRNIFGIIILTGTLNSIVGIYQFFFQQSLGLFWLKESLISPDMIGVAKIIIDGEVFIRAYGMFPHPNIFGGFLILSILTTRYYYDLYLSRKNVPRGTISQTKVICATYQSGKSMNNYSNQKNYKRWISGFINVFHVEQLNKNTLSKGFFMGIQIMALILTFSKSAILGFIIAVIYLNYKKKKNDSSLGDKECFTWNILTQAKPDSNESKRNLLFHVEQFVDTIKTLLTRSFGCYRKKIAIFAIIIMLIVLFKPNFYSLVTRSIEDRTFFANVSRETFTENPILGVGAGQYVLSLADRDNLLYWQYQPVHNVFLLILNEVGIIGLIIVVISVLGMFHVKHSNRTKDKKCSTWNNALNRKLYIVPRGTIYYNKSNVHFKAVLIGFIFIMLFDHYFWTIQQGQLLLGLVLGLWISYKK